MNRDPKPSYADLSEPAPDAAQEAFDAERDRHVEALKKLLAEHPRFAQHFACGELGAALAMCDFFGLDAVSHISEFRRRIAVELGAPAGASS
jgi:hypothetical protein